MQLQEETRPIWEKRQSCWAASGTYLLGGFILLLALGVGIAYHAGFGEEMSADLQGIYWIAVLTAAVEAVVLLCVTVSIKCTHWKLTPERLTRCQGVFSRRIDNLIWATDESDEVMTIEVEDPESLYEWLRKYSEKAKSRTGHEAFVEVMSH